MKINWGAVLVSAIWLACGMACLGTKTEGPLWFALVLTLCAAFSGALNE